MKQRSAPEKERLGKDFTVPLSAVNGLSRLTTMWQARPIGKFANWPMTFESNRIGTADSNRIGSRSFAGPYFTFFYVVLGGQLQPGWLI